MYHYLLRHILLISFACLAFMWNAANAYTSLKGINIEEQNGLTHFKIELNKPTVLKPTMLGESVVIDLPDDIVWEAPTSMDAGEGRVKNYSIESGELVIHLKQGTALKEVKIFENAPNNEVLLVFAPGNPKESYHIEKIEKQKKSIVQHGHGKLQRDGKEGLVIHGIQMHHDDDKQNTQLVFHLNHTADLIAGVDGDHLTVKFPRNTVIDLKNAPKIEGNIQRLYVEEEGDGKPIAHIHLASHAKVKNSFVINGDHPRYVVNVAIDHKTIIDLPEKATTTRAVGVHHNLTHASPPKLAHAFKSTIPPKHAAAPHISTPVDDAPMEVKAFTIDVIEGTTHLLVSLTKPAGLKVVENKHIHQLTIQLPKTIWEDVPIHEAEDSVVASYFVDQSHPKWSTLAVTLKDHSVLLDQQLVADFAGYPAFVLTVGNQGKAWHHWGKNVVGSWGLGAAKTYDDKDEILYHGAVLQKNENGTVVQKSPFAFETEKPTLDPKDPFQGGTADFADVGKGFYAGVSMGYGAGHVKTEVKTGAPLNTTHHAKRSMDGFDVGMHVGYGKGFGKFLLGAETFLHYAFQEGRGVYRADANTTAHIKNSVWYKYGIGARFGFYVAPETLFSLGIGGTGTIMRHKVSGDMAGYGYGKAFRQNMGGLYYTLGLETALNDHMSVRFELMHTDFQHFLNKRTNPIAQEGRFAAKTNRVSLGFNYQFNHMFGPNSDSGIGVIPTGFYVGTGFDMATIALNRHFDNGSHEIVSQKATSSTPVWFMHMGYGVQYGDKYFGLELEGALGTPYIKERYADAGSVENYRVSVQPIFGVYFRPGYTFGHGNMIYAKLGFVASHFLYKGQGATGSKFTTGHHFRKSMVGVAFGGGLEAFANEHISVRGEYLFEIYQKLHHKVSNKKETFVPTNSKVQFGVSYLF